MPILQERGDFWYLAEPHNKVAGELKIEEDGKVSLELEKLPASKTPPKRITKAIELSVFPSLETQEKGMCGVLKKEHQAVFLYGLTRDTTLDSLGDKVSNIPIQIRDCFIGKKAFPDVEEKISFKKLSVNLRGFEGWLCLRSINSNSESDLLPVFESSGGRVLRVL